MMKKSALLLFITCLLFLNVAAQRQITYFLKNNGKLVRTIDSADYTRMVEEPEKGSSLYPTVEFYLNKNIKSIGYSSRIVPPKYERRFMSFYKNGNKKEVLNYAHGERIDTAYTYYPNGELYSSMIYDQAEPVHHMSIKTMKDSTGKELVTDGNGHAVYYDDDFRYVKEEGGVKNGKPDGKWSGVLVGKDTLSYKETYVEGKMVSGESTDGKTNVYRYTVLEVQPGYRGGMDGFYRYIQHEIRYPRSLIKQGIEGVVNVSFTVLKNGEIGNVHVLNQVHPDMAAEAVRVLELSKGWTPGIQKGRVVNVVYSIPITFSFTKR